MELNDNNMKNVKILMAEDDEDDQSFFRQALLDAGIASVLTTVPDGEQLLDVLQNLKKPHFPDIIFLDINMPGMDGKSCLREIRRQERFAKIPVIILTTSTRPKDIEETYRDGANRYISKMIFYSDGLKWMGRLFATGWRKGLIDRSRERFAHIS
jgi:CheY-like chemotaxis protein